jgi:hypothetical protein
VKSAISSARSVGLLDPENRTLHDAAGILRGWRQDRLIEMQAG